MYQFVQIDTRCTITFIEDNHSYSWSLCTLRKQFWSKGLDFHNAKDCDLQNGMLI